MRLTAIFEGINDEGDIEKAILLKWNWKWVKIGPYPEITVCLVNKANNKRTEWKMIKFYDCNCYEYFHFHGNFVCDILWAKTLSRATLKASFWVSEWKQRRRLSKHVRQIKRTIHHFLLSSLLIAAVSSVVVVKCRIFIYDVNGVEN